MSLAEAQGKVPAADGMRIHRSHWVAFDQMVRLKFENGNPKLVITSGETLPVSRGQVSKLKKHLGTPAA